MHNAGLSITNKPSKKTRDFYFESQCFTSSSYRIKKTRGSNTFKTILTIFNIKGNYSSTADHKLSLGTNVCELH